MPTCIQIGYILKQVAKKFGIFLQNLLLYHYFKIERCLLDEEKKMNFLLRFSNINNKQEEARYLNASMQFIMILTNQDVTLRCLERKKKLKQNLANLQFSSKQYWTNFLNFCYNLQTTKSQIMQEMEKIKASIQIQWELPINSQYQIFFKSYQIYKNVLAKYKFDLFQLRKQIGLNMFGNVTGICNLQNIQDMQLSLDEKIFLQQNFHLFSNINHRLKINQFQRYDPLVQFREKAKEIKEPGILFQYLIDYAQFLTAESPSLIFGEFTQRFKNHEIVYKSKFVRQISNIIHRQKLQIYNGQRHYEQFFRYSYNFCFQFYLCRHSYFLQLIFQPDLNKAIVQDIEESIKKIRKQYFYGDIQIFLRKCHKSTQIQILNIKNYIYTKLKQDFYKNKQQLGKINIIQCQTFLLLLTKCYNSDLNEYIFISDAIQEFRHKVINSHPNIALTYFSTQIFFYMFQFGQQRFLQLFQYFTKIIQRFSSQNNAQTKFYRFQSIVFALSFSNGTQSLSAVSYHEKAINYLFQQSQKGKGWVIERNCFCLVGKYFIIHEKYRQSFNYIINLLKKHQGIKKNTIQMKLYLMTRYYLKFINYFTGQKYVLQLIEQFEKLTLSQSYLQMKNISNVIIILQFIFDIIYIANKINNRLFFVELKIKQFDLMFRWVHYLVPLAYHAVKIRFANKIGFYLLNFTKKSLFKILSQNKTRKILLKKLRNTQYYFETRGLQKKISAVIKNKQTKSQKILKYLQQIRECFTIFNENKKEKPDLANLNIQSKTKDMYIQFVNQNSINPCEFVYYYDRERQLSGKPKTNIVHKQIADKLLQMMFC